MLCLRCKFASPVGAVFCARCGQGFGCRVCSSGHRSPAAAKWCVVCGKPDNEMSGATSYVPLAWLSRLAAWGTVAWIVLWILRNPSAAIAWITGATLWAVARALGVTECAVIFRSYRLVYDLMLIYLLSFLLPGGAGQAFRKALAVALSRLPRLAFVAARELWRALWRMVEAPRDTNATVKKPK